MSRSCLAIILAAGEGTRMRSSIPKVMHPVAGTPMLGHVLETTASALADTIAVVVGNQAELVTDYVKQQMPEAATFEQKERLGTAHAVLAARTVLENAHDDVLVVFGDTPLVTRETLLAIRSELARGAGVVVLGFLAKDPSGYGRLLVEDGKLVAIREDKDASAAEKKVDFCNGGIMGFAGASGLEMLDAIRNDNAKGEFYLTDIVEIANRNGMLVSAIEAPEEEILGVNTREGLADVEAIWQDKRRREMLAAGVTMIDPSTVYLSKDTVLEADVLLEPNVFFGPGATVRSRARIRAFCHIEDAVIGSNAEIGPYARLRPGVQLGSGTKVGNFVEIKKSVVHDGAKVNHLSYVGDSIVGKNANIGAGTITCNYDGLNKHLTRIGEGAFIGSNSSLVAPVSIGDGAYVASGSVITEDIPDNAMGVARGRQSNKTGYAETIRERNQKLKAGKSQGG